MIQFNLEEYLKNPDKKIVTRAGDDVKIIYTNRVGGDSPVVALVLIRGAEYVYTYTADGHFLSTGKDHPNDLFFVSEEHIGWINLYYLPIGCNKKSPATKRDIIHFTEHTAKEAAAGNPNYITTVKVEWEDQV